jgi:hypothetical protein
MGQRTSAPEVPVSWAVRKGEGGMNVKSVWLGGLVATVLGLGVAHGQGPAMPSGDLGLSKPVPATTGTGGLDPVGPPVLADTVAVHRDQPSDWILGPRPAGCCGVIGLNGPIEGEAYIRAGISFPVGGAIFSKTLDNGWDIEGGVRSLFLNKEQDAAWVVELGITNIFNPGTTNGLVVNLANVPVTTPSPITGAAATTVVVPNLSVTVKNLNRTYGDLAIGREIWLLGNAQSSREELNWRIGTDFGGRWGSDKVELNGLNHRTATIGGVFVAVYSDIEVPVGSLIFIGGIRGEWGYTWNQVLQTSNNSENVDINVLFQLGVRF